MDIICHVYNTTSHAATGSTPFKLIYGHQIEQPTALTKLPKSIYNYDDYAQELRERVRAMSQLANKQERIKVKQQYDKSTKVIFQGKRHKMLMTTHYDKAIQKLEFLRTGPYIILERNSDVNYIIKKGKKIARVHK